MSWDGQTLLARRALLAGAWPGRPRRAWQSQRASRRCQPWPSFLYSTYSGALPALVMASRRRRPCSAARARLPRPWPAAGGLRMRAAWATGGTSARAAASFFRVAHTLGQRELAVPMVDVIEHPSSPQRNSGRSATATQATPQRNTSGGAPGPSAWRSRRSSRPSRKPCRWRDPFAGHCNASTTSCIAWPHCLKPAPGAHGHSLCCHGTQAR